jgi:hypothetical protein
MWFIAKQLLVLLGVQHVPNLVWKLIDVMKLFQLVEQLESFHLQISGYQIEISIWWLVLKTNK